MDLYLYGNRYLTREKVDQIEAEKVLAALSWSPPPRYCLCGGDQGFTELRKFRDALGENWEFTCFTCDYTRRMR